MRFERIREESEQRTQIWTKKQKQKKAKRLLCEYKVTFILGGNNSGNSTLPSKKNIGKEKEDVLTAALSSHILPDYTFN